MPGWWLWTQSGGGDEDEDGHTWGYQPRTEFPPGRLDKVLGVAALQVVGRVAVLGNGLTVGADAGGRDYASDHFGIGLCVQLGALRE